ncbi:MAG: hypothetical protein LBD86_04490 [Spirochaetaceae bacterium]|jgi:hypothetical protein|nr:hypothetical protein [Spirochaetaceae bacterium]
MKITAFKPLLLTVLSALLPVTQSGAATVSIMIIETSGNPNAVSGTAGIWEGGMMDVFFELGHIVSNAPALNVLQADDEVLNSEARSGFEEADRNGADYFVVARLDYPIGGEVKGTQKPERVSLKLYKIHPYGILYDKNFDADFSTHETLSNAKKAAMILATYLRGGS